MNKVEILNRLDKIEQTSTIVCKKCGVIHDTETLILETIPLPGGGRHIKVICPICKSFIKFLPHSVPALWFGKYKGRTISEIAQKDPSYLQWLVKQDIKSARLKAAIEEALCQTSK